MLINLFCRSLATMLSSSTTRIVAAFISSPCLCNRKDGSFSAGLMRRNLQVPALLQFLSTRFTQPQNPHPSLFRDRERKPELGAIRGQDFHGAAKLLNHGLNQVKTRGSGAAKVDVLGQPGAIVANDQGHTIAVLW